MVLSRTYRVREFAELAGVTVRALHHYDRLGLLRPKRTHAGYRVYSLADLERLEQIVALKFLGLPLKQIEGVLDRDSRPLADVLHAQRRALEEKRRRLTAAIGAIADAEASLTGGRPADTAVLKRIIEVIEMSDHAEDMKKYYSDDAWAELTRRREAMTEKIRDVAMEGTRKWQALFKDVETALGEDPAGPAAQALLDRWQALIDEFTGGSRQIKEGLGRAWQDRRNWSPAMQNMTQAFSKPEVWEFIRKAGAARARVGEVRGATPSD